MKEVLLICGGNGLLAQHFIQYCQNNAQQCAISEIRTIDKQPFVKLLDYETKIPVTHYQYDLCDESDAVDAVFAGCTTVIYCARKNYEYLYTADDPTEQYQHDNVQACSTTMKRLLKHNIENLVFVSDAYGNLPNGDNYGLSEQMHIEAPKSFILGSYGESITTAELNAFKYVEEGEINGIFLRPVMVYGEGEKNLTGSMLKFCRSYGSCPNISGDDRGNHQYIYIGNLVAIVNRCIECLRTDPKRYNTEIIYCMDQTTCTPFKNFIKPFMELYEIPINGETSYFTAFLSSVYHGLLYKIGFSKSTTQLTFTAQRFLYGWSVGFSNRKLRLLLDFQPPIQQSEAIEKTLRWYKSNPKFFDS